MRITCWLVSIAIAIVFSGCRSNVDLTKFPAGLEKKPVLCPNTIRPEQASREFMPFSKSFTHDSKGNLLFRVEKRSLQEPWHYAAIGPVPVKPVTRYSLIFCLEKQYKDDISFYVTYSRNGRPDVSPHVFLLNQFYGVRSPSGETVYQDMITPSDCDGLYIWLLASNNGKPVKPGVRAVLTRFELQELEPAVPAPELAARGGDNLLQFDLSKMQPGMITKADSVFFPGRKNAMVVSEVVKEGAEKILRVKYKKGMYLYPHFTSLQAPFYNSLCRYSFKIRGKGMIRPGLWFKRDYVGFYYSHGAVVTLNEKWQNVVLEYGCVDPLTRAVSVSITNSGDLVEYDVKDLKLEVVNPH
jgi:hypothetical protein